MATATKKDSTSTPAKRRSTSTAAKSASTKKTAAKEVADIKSEPIEEAKGATAPAKVAAVRKYSAGDLIPCKSVTYGELIYIGKNGATYEWTGYGDICEVDYSDLLSMKTGRQKFLKEPWIIILDDELTSQWRLSDINDLFRDIGDIEDLISSGFTNVRKALSDAPSGYKELIKKTAARMLREGRLDSIATVKVIDDSLGTNLSMLLGGMS